MVPAGPERPALLADPGVRADARLEDGKTVRGSSQLCGSPRIVDRGEGEKEKAALLRKSFAIGYGGASAAPDPVSGRTVFVKSENSPRRILLTGLEIIG